MNLHEYQGKLLFAQYNLPVSKGEVIFSANDAIEACNKIGGSKWVVKAQVHAGGRGKAGGVKIVDNLKNLEKEANILLGKNLITHQTGPLGREVKRLYAVSYTHLTLPTTPYV